MVFLVALGLRLAGLGTFMIADEERWMMRSSWFWHEVVQRDFKNTFMTTHPGTTLMWLAGGGIAWQAQTQDVGIELEEAHIKDFIMAAKLPVAVATAVLVAVATYCLMHIFRWRTALTAGLFLASDPYLVGLSQIVHLDALLALSMLASLLAVCWYIYRPQNKALYLAAVLAGFALATKFLPALWLIAFGITLLFGQRILRPGGWALKLKQAAWPTLGWLVVAGIVFVLLCPALFYFNDIGNENYTSGLTTSLQDDAVAIATDEHISLTDSTDPIRPETFYGRTLLSRTPLFTLILATGALLTLIRVLVWVIKEPRAGKGMGKFLPLLILISYSFGFLILITFAAKKGERYALPALVVFPILAGWTLSVAWPLLKERLHLFVPPLVIKIVPVVILFLVVSQPLLWAPYAIAYDNQLWDIRQRSQQGWGEGLDEAARWLNQHPLNGPNFYIASWYPAVMSHYFGGKTLSLSSRDDGRVAFVVTYRNMSGRALDSIATSVLEEYQDQEPAKVISIGGLPYVWIYNTIGVRYFTRNTGELHGDQEVGQTIPITRDHWNSIDIGLATYDSRHNTQDVILHIRETAEATTDMRAVTVNASTIADSAWQRFTFQTIPDSAGKTYFVSLTSPTSYAGNAITVKFSEQDIVPGNFIRRNRPLAPGEINAAFVRHGDMAYRLP